MKTMLNHGKLCKTISKVHNKKVIALVFGIYCVELVLLA